MVIKKGDRVRITGAFRRARSVIVGKVITAEDNGSRGEPNWYIELKPEDPPAAYLYWKQSVDGGEVEKV